MAKVRVHQSHFATVPKINTPRSTFDRSHVYKTTFDAGKLIPIFVDEALPGDSWKLNSTVFARLSTPAVPFMDNLYFNLQFYAVPMRLVWEHFVNMCGEQEDPDDSTDYLVPQFQPVQSDFINVSEGKVTNEGSKCGRHSLWDYFGLPTRKPSGTSIPSVSMLYFRAYWLIWNQWFRDENLQDSVKIDRSDANRLVKTDDDETVNGFSVYYPAPRGKRFDYFTSALRSPQKGTAPVLSFGSSAPVVTTGEQVKFDVNGLGDFPFVVAAQQGSPGGGLYGTNVSRSDYTDKPIAFGSVTGLRADLTKSGSVLNINDIRMAFQVQRFLEKNARGGTRYNEFLLVQYGVVSSDARLQRAEFLGGFTKMVHVNPVVQTSATDDITPQGNLAAYAVLSARIAGFRKSFTEHTMIIGVCSVRADLTYQEGINRMWLHKSIYDFALPVFAHLGEQPIYNKEIFVSGADVDDEAFGYQERYAEYRYKPSMITGKFRSSDPQSLDVWHLSQDFKNLPTLSNEFIQDNPPVKRVLAVQDEPDFLLDVAFNCKVTRCLPLYGTPGLVDHY